MKKYPRKIKLIKPAVQLHITMVIVGVSTLGLLLQFNLFASRLTKVALDLPSDGPVMADRMGELLLDLFLTSGLLFLPLIFAVGVLTTFRMVGPIHRFEIFLKAVLAGQHPEECRIRQGDHLGDLCELLNEVTAEVRCRQVVKEEALDPDSMPAITPTSAVTQDVTNVQDSSTATHS